MTSAFGNGGGFVGPCHNGGYVDYLRQRARPVLVSDLGAELGGNIHIIDADLLLDDASVPDGMEVGFGACPLNRNEVSAAVIVKGYMQGLMNIANPMPKAFKQPKLVAHVEAEGKIPRVVQDRGDDAPIGNRTGMCSLDAFCRARQVHIMLGRTDMRVIRRGAGVGEGAELRVDRDKGIDASFDLGF